MLIGYFYFASYRLFGTTGYHVLFQSVSSLEDTTGIILVAQQSVLKKRGNNNSITLPEWI